MEWNEIIKGYKKIKLKFNNWLYDGLSEEEIKKCEEEEKKEIEKTIHGTSLGFIIGIILYNVILYFL